MIHWYAVVKGCISMFGCTDLEIVGGHEDLEKALELFNDTAPDDTVKGNLIGRVYLIHTLMEK